MPFQVAYTVPIHKAVGLEYGSVKIVVTDANEDDLSHSIFDTAVTRAREHLRIVWTSETQYAVLSNMQRVSNPRDVALLFNRVVTGDQLQRPLTQQWGTNALSRLDCPRGRSRRRPRSGSGPVRTTRGACWAIRCCDRQPPAA